MKFLVEFRREAQEEHEKERKWQKFFFLLLFYTQSIDVFIYSFLVSLLPPPQTHSFKKNLNKQHTQCPSIEELPNCLLLSDTWLKHNDEERKRQ